MNPRHTLPWQGPERPYFRTPNDFRDFRHWAPLQLEPQTNFPQEPLPRRRQTSLLGPGRTPYRTQSMTTSISASTSDSPNTTTSPSSRQSTNSYSSSSSPPDERRVSETCVLCARLGLTCTPLSDTESCGECYALSAECYYSYTTTSTTPGNDNSHHGHGHGHEYDLNREIALANLSAYYTEKMNLHASYMNNLSLNIKTTTYAFSHTYPTPSFPPSSRLSPSNFIWHRGAPRFPIQDFSASIPEGQNTPGFPAGYGGFSAYGFSARSRGRGRRAEMGVETERVDGGGGGLLPLLTPCMMPWNRIFPLSLPLSYRVSGDDGGEVLERHDLNLEDPRREGMMVGGGYAGSGKRGGGGGINGTLNASVSGGLDWPVGASWDDM